MMEDLTLHQQHLSGNCYKIRLTAALLGLKLKLVDYDVVKAETQTEHFRTKVSANGRVPVLQIGSDTFLPESNAACYYLAGGSKLIPTDRLEHAEMLGWMFWEQYQHEPNIAVLRYWYSFLHLTRESMSESQKAMLPNKEKGSEAALDLMNGHLASRNFLVGGKMTLADIALYAYTHVANDAGFDLKRWPNVASWCERVSTQPGYVSMPA